MKTIHDVHRKLSEKIAALKTSISKAVAYSTVEINDNKKAFYTAIDNGVYKDVNTDALEYGQMKDELAGLIETTTKRLMLVNTDFILMPKNAKLTSPAGFHPDERVFIEVPNSIPTNKLPKSSNLEYIDLRKL